MSPTSEAAHSLGGLVLRIPSAKEVVDGQRPQETTGRLTPARFLRDLGIRRSCPARVFTDRYWRDVRRAGGDPRALAVHGTFSRQAGDVYFITEDIARRSLSAEYDWFLRTLQNFRRVDGYPVEPRRVADLGGGTGIVSLHLAACHPNCQVAVYDHAPRQLQLGRKWAREQNLSNVRYVQASYEQLAKEPGTGDNDLVLFFRGLDLRIPAPGTCKAAESVDACPSPRPHADVQAAMTALARLVSPDGVGVIACAWSEWGLVHLFEAVRRAGLGVDWRFSRFRQVGEGGGPVLVEDYIFVRRGIPHLGQDSREDARAHVLSMQYHSGPVLLNQEQRESEVQRFRDGTVLLEAEGLDSADGIEQVRVVEKGGLLLLYASSAGGFRGGMQHSLAGIAPLLKQIQLYLDSWQDGDEAQFRRLRIHPRLRWFVDYCQQQPATSE